MTAEWSSIKVRVSVHGTKDWVIARFFTDYFNKARFNIRIIKNNIVTFIILKYITYINCSSVFLKVYFHYSITQSTIRTSEHKIHNIL